MNHQRTDVVASDPRAKRATPSGPSMAAAQAAEERGGDQHREEPRHSPPVRAAPVLGRSAPRAEVHALQSSGERGREEDREQQTEHSGRLPDVLGRSERLPGGREGVTPNAELGRDGGDDRRANALRHEGGDHDHEWEERHECLPCQRDAAIDELDLEHALPHPPDEQALQPSSEDSETLTHVSDSSTLCSGGTGDHAARARSSRHPEGVKPIHVICTMPIDDAVASLGRGYAWVSRSSDHRSHGPSPWGAQGPGHGVGAGRALLPAPARVTRILLVDDREAGDRAPSSSAS